jgi:hypothetical protein
MKIWRIGAGLPLRIEEVDMEASYRSVPTIICWMARPDGHEDARMICDAVNAEREGKTDG